MSFTSILLVGLIALVTAVVLMLTRLLRYRDTDASSHPTPEIDLSRYAALGRVMDPSEVEFLAQQPGTTPARIRAFRKSRRKLFRSYLRELAVDFHHLHAEARAVAATAPQEHHELVGMLMQQQVRFWGSLAMLETQLFLEAAGLGRVNADGLLQGMENLHTALVRATATPGPVAVPNR